MANGRVFVASRTNLAGYGTFLTALDQRTGAILWGPTALAGVYFWAGLAYDDGRVIALSGDGLLRAFDAATGALLWTKVIGYTASSSAPTAVGGTVFTADEHLEATWAADGGRRWLSAILGGRQSSPAVTATGVYVSFPCDSWGASRATGIQSWHRTSGCFGGSGKTVAVYRGRVYTRDNNSGNLILNAATGAELGRIFGNDARIPAFSGDLMFLNVASQLRAVALGDAGVGWTFTPPSSTLHTAPLVVGPHVIIASPNQLFVLDKQTGSVVSSEGMTDIQGPDEWNHNRPLAGFAAADGMLFVPVGNSLAAY